MPAHSPKFTFTVSLPASVCTPTASIFSPVLTSEPPKVNNCAPLGDRVAERDGNARINGGDRGEGGHLIAHALPIGGQLATVHPFADG